MGSSIYYVNFTVNTQKNSIGTEIYISNDKDKFKMFVDCKEEIESALGLKLEWREAKKDCRILASYSGDIKKGTVVWQAYFDWMCKMALKFKAMIGKYGM